MFSRRLPWDRPENALAAAETARHQAGGAVLDLTVSNPTTVDLPYPVAALREALAPPEVATYAPAPRGLPSARAAVAADYARRGCTVDPDRLLLTASSSESYALLFKLLCDPGDAVLIPEPGYPLFDYLARLEGVQPIAYRLAYDGVWHIDFASIDAALAAARAAGQRTPALIVVSPNNPTGSFLKADERRRLATLCARGGMALIADEVFADFPFGARPGDAVACAAAAAAAGAAPVLTFSLGGLSKSCGLPQIKLGWIVAGGSPSDVAMALGRLELIADTYLSVATPVQLAAPDLLALGGTIRAAITARVAANRARLQALLPSSSPCTLLPAEAGWSAILRVPAVMTDAEWAVTLLQRDGVLVQPGYFFDLPGPGAFLVVSLLPPPSIFAEAMARVVDRCSGLMEGS
ncbi:MAG TPA: pyridoxal phosphate-dependent aminotransferase [Polyangia bacterium]|nr:pyridoxal phosphate-dependent aminotransferase [Polyangia bacterium]